VGCVNSRHLVRITDRKVARGVDLESGDSSDRRRSLSDPVCVSRENCQVWNDSDLQRGERGTVFYPGGIDDHCARIGGKSPFRYSTAGELVSDGLKLRAGSSTCWRGRRNNCHRNECLEHLQQSLASPFFQPAEYLVPTLNA